jgi:capsular polysaccharide biosynthesis protein
MRNRTQHTAQLASIPSDLESAGVAIRSIAVSNRRASGAGFVSELRQTVLGRLYVNHLKQVPAIRAIVIWLWKNAHPLYARCFSCLRTCKWKSLVRFGDYFESSKEEKYVLVESCVAAAPVPRVYPPTEQKHLASPTDRLIFPKVRVAVLTGAIQYGGTNLVIVEDQAVCHDLYDFRRDFTSEELHARHQIDHKRNRMRCFLYDDGPEEIRVAATFVDACATNYAHWMTEVLPRVVLFCADTRFRGVPIIVNDGLHKNIMESLLLAVGHGREIITLPIGRALRVGRLYLTSATGYVPFDRRNNKRAGHSHGLFCPEALLRLRQLLPARDQTTDHDSPEKIYLKRTSGTRKIANAVEVEQILISHGYTTVEPEKLSFTQQMRLFNNARMIIGPSGSAIANAIYCRTDAEVTILMGKHEKMIYRYWCNMLAPLGVRVNYILGDIAKERHLGIHGDFEIAPADLIDLLEVTEAK